MANAKAAAESDDRIKLIARNKRATFDYVVEKTLEAGLELLGSEVKSLREGQANLADSYAIPKDGQLYLLNAHVGPYRPSSVFSHSPTRTRRSEEHTSELQSPDHLVCRLLLEKKKKNKQIKVITAN